MSSMFNCFRAADFWAANSLPLPADVHPDAVIKVSIVTDGRGSAYRAEILGEDRDVFVAPRADYGADTLMFFPPLSVPCEPGARMPSAQSPWLLYAGVAAGGLALVWLLAGSRRRRTRSAR